MADEKIVKLEKKTGNHYFWLLDGKRVETWTDHDRCLRCGRPLRSTISRARGYGQECEEKNIWNHGPVAVLIVSTETEG